MAEPFSHMDSGILDASTKLDKLKNVKDSISSPPHQIDPSQTKSINPIKNPKQESKADYSDNPKEFLDLSNKHLSLSNISLLISSRSGYKKLNLSGCGLTVLPEDLRYCHELEELNLSNNPLSISSLEFGPWRRLKKLDLSGCGLRTLPKEFRCCHELEELNLSDNPLSISSLGFELWLRLKKLDLSGCGLRTLPKEFRYCRELEELNLSNNSLSISSLEFEPLHRLKKLNLSGCGLTVLPKEFRYCHKLEELNLSNNPLSHLYTPSLEYIPWHRLKKLDLSGCGLTTSLESLDFCHGLEELNLSNNPLSHLYLPYMPSFQYGVPWCRLQRLDLSGCGLTTLPEGLRYFHELEELNLSNNPLTYIFNNSHISFMRFKPWCKLKKLDLSGCGLTELPNGLEKCGNLQELNLSNNSFDHQDLLEKLNSVKVFSYSNFHKSGKELLEPTASGLGLSKLTCKIIFEDAIYTQSSGVWIVAHKVADVASTRYASSTKGRYKGQMRLEELNWFSGLSLQNEEIWLDEFCRIRKSEKLTIETYHSMLQSLKIVRNLVSMNNVKNRLEREPTLDRCCREILLDLNHIELPTRRNPASQYVQQSIFYLKSAVSWLRIWPIKVDDDKYKLKQTIMTCGGMAFKKAFEAFSEESSTAVKILAAKLIIISTILSNLTKPEAAVLLCLQSLQELHDLHTIREEFSFLDRDETKITYLEPEQSFEIVKSVLQINKILFEFVQMFFKPPLTVKEWPATIQLDEQIYNPLIDGRLLKERLIDAGMAVSGPVNLDIGENDNKVKDPITDVAEYSVIESSGQTPDNSITVDQKGGCFSLPEASAFLLFPPNAVEEEITLKCSRVKHKECEVKPSDGEVFVSRILKVEPEGVTFKKPVTVLLSHSLDEDQVFLYFYELIIENLSPTGCQELKTERISSIEDVPKEISNKEILDDYLPFAKATIHETCTLVAATRARFNQILIPTNRRYAFSKQYGDKAELKITFPAGVTKKILILKVQLFPADAVLNKDIRLNKSLVCAPIIRVSGQRTPFLKAVDVELTYSHSDVVNIEENFLPIGKTTQFTTEYGLLLHNHKETESKYNWQALNENNDVSIERLRKDQLKFSFSVKHFSDVQPVVKTNTAVSFVPPMNAGVVDMNNPACHHAIVLAVHKSGSSPKTLHAVLAPKHAENRLYIKWKVKGCRFMSRLKCEEPIYFCVPMSDTTESDHLPLKDYTLWFDPDDESELANNTNDSVELRGKDMRFLKDRECNNGENHTTQGDCRAKVQIHISETRSVKASTESREPVLDIESPQERNVSSGEEDAQLNNNQISEIMMHRCELFEKAVETAAQKKLEINRAVVKDPKGGKATKFMDVAGPTTTVISSLACGITIAMGVATFGAASFAAAFVAGATLVVKIVDKHFKQANAKVVEKVLETATDKAKISSYLNCIAKDVAKELSRIFESQLFELQSDKQVEILAECAVDLMLDLKKGDTFDRNTLLKNVLQDGNIKKKKILTRTKDIEWSAPNVFRKSGLRRMIFGKDGAEFKYFVKPNEACKTRKYGYRGQFLEAKNCVSQQNEDEAAATDEIPTTDETHNEDPCEEFCKECFFNYENCTSGQYFSESDIDSQYTKSQDELSTYNPLHILIQCPKVLDSFNQLQKEKPSLANFLKNKLGLPTNHLVHPIYRQHSPGKVPDLQKSDLTGSDFSHSDFTNSTLKECHFIKCVMLFVKLGGTKMSGSKFCDTLISHSNLEKLEADHCEWTKTSLLYSNVKGAYLDSVEPSIGGNCFDGTNICDAITGNKRELNCNEKLAQAKMSGSKLCCDTLIRDSNSVEMRADYREGTKTSLLHSNVDGAYLDFVEPILGGNCLDGNNICDAITGKKKELNCNETRV